MESEQALTFESMPLTFASLASAFFISSEAFSHLALSEPQAATSDFALLMSAATVCANGKEGKRGEGRLGVAHTLASFSTTASSSVAFLMFEHCSEALFLPHSLSTVAMVFLAASNA